MNRRIRLPDMRKVPMLILRTGLPLIIGVLIYIAVYTYTNTINPTEPIEIIYKVTSMLEHALMSLALLFGGSLLFEKYISST